MSNSDYILEKKIRQRLRKERETLVDEMYKKNIADLEYVKSVTSIENMVADANVDEVAGSG